jgi:hypothetical protein
MKRSALEIYRRWLAVVILALIGAIAFAAGVAWASRSAQAEEGVALEGEPVMQQTPQGRQPRVIYPKRSELDFEGAQIEGEVRNPGEFYFQRRPEEKFDSLVKRRKNFHREMMRDVVLSK